MSANISVGRNRTRSSRPVGSRKNVLWPRVNRKASSRLANAPAPAMMGLPRLPSTIPKELILPVDAQRTAKIALAMLDAGLVAVADIVDGNRHPLALVQNAFKRWFEQITNPLSIFSLNLILTDSVSKWGAGFDDENAAVTLGFEKDEERIAIGVAYSGWSRFFLKDKVEAVEQVAPGLGKAAMEKLEAIIHSATFAITPAFVEDTARYTYWGGLEDETEYLDEYGMDCDEEEIESMKEEMITLADVKALMPPLDSPSLEAEAIADLVLSENPLVASVAALLTEADSNEGYDYPTHLDQVSQDGTTCSEPGIWLQWQSDDLTHRIMDDWYAYVSECGSTDLCAFWTTPLSSEKVASCFKNIERAVARLVWAERMLALIGTLDES